MHIDFAFCAFKVQSSELLALLCKQRSYINIGVMEKKMEATIEGYIGCIYRRSMGVMEKKLEATI